MSNGLERNDVLDQMIAAKRSQMADKKKSPTSLDLEDIDRLYIQVCELKMLKTLTKQEVADRISGLTSIKQFGDDDEKMQASSALAAITEASQQIRRQP